MYTNTSPLSFHTWNATLTDLYLWTCCKLMAIASVFVTGLSTNLWRHSGKGHLLRAGLMGCVPRTRYRRENLAAVSFTFVCDLDATIASIATVWDHLTTVSKEGIRTFTPSDMVAAQAVLRNRLKTSWMSKMILETTTLVPFLQSSPRSIVSSSVVNDTPTSSPLIRNFFISAMVWALSP